MRNKNSSRVWVVVEVQSGIPTLAEVYSERLSAEKREVNLRKKLRQDYVRLVFLKPRSKPPSLLGRPDKAIAERKPIEKRPPFPKAALSLRQ